MELGVLSLSDLQTDPATGAPFDAEQRLAEIVSYAELADRLTRPAPRTLTENRKHTFVNVTVFGATGAIGRHVVSQLLEQGHHVTAYLRTPGNLDTKHPQLRTVVGELSDATAVTEAIGGSDAVISALGPSLKRSASGTPVADGTSNIVTAMHRAGVRRFIGLATPSIADPRDRPTFKACLLPAMAKAMFPTPSSN
jgi:NAD(P)H-binding